MDELPNGNIRPSYSSCLFWNCAEEECEEDRREYRSRISEIYARAKKPIPWNLYYPIPE